ncbi:MAG: thiamine-phosphate pyrophosphorylase [Elusimicrobiota bacterium]|nr:thiamine-phosphate pyrophosphorylase [Endomicrobiia bacterium]MCX7910321.1 thiamine-phosphate pyrophosphorylase [Endomicrobiia bacterium]MDW8165224.1 thiamine-phosphate pyrophosphorylase [Elusimicrobiota bacterium]
MKLDKRILRIIDANINRALEGIRVVEDILRFVFKNTKYYNSLRKIRHQLPKLFLDIYSFMVLQRDSISDPGRIAKEKKYKDINHILISNLHRITESLRVLEEVSKFTSIKKVPVLKKLRYDVYQLEKNIIEKILK